jgi:hypothetical protein
MGMFLKKSESNGHNDFDFMYKIVTLISDNNSNVMENVKFCITHPQAYSQYNTGRYDERGIDIEDADDDEICWIGMVDELAECKYLISVDYNSEPNDILWALSQLKSYYLIEKYISDIDLQNDNINDAESLAKEINIAVSGAYVCMIDIDSDSYELIIVNHDVYDEISALAEDNGHSIEIF